MQLVLWSLENSGSPAAWAFWGVSALARHRGWPLQGNRTARCPRSGASLEYCCSGHLSQDPFCSPLCKNPGAGSRMGHGSLFEVERKKKLREKHCLSPTGPVSRALHSEC